MDVLKNVSLVSPVNQVRVQLARRFDGRYEPMNPKGLAALHEGDHVVVIEDEVMGSAGVTGWSSSRTR